MPRSERIVASDTHTSRWLGDATAPDNSACAVTDIQVVPLAGIVQDQHEIDAVARVLRGTWHVAGPECTALQHEFARYVGVRHAIVVNSGSLANLITLKALALPAGSTIITGGCGFPATLNPILHAGHIPLLTDHHLPSHNVDLDQVEALAAAHPEARAILVAHTLGNPLDLDRLVKICDQNGLALIEDCCEAIGSRWRGRPVGSFGTAATMSFYSSHQINGLGGGGLILTDRDDLAARMVSLRDWGKTPLAEGDRKTRFSEVVDGVPYDQQYSYQTVGFNARYPDANCAYTRVQLEKLEQFNAVRRRNYLRLDAALRDLPLIRMTWPDAAEPAFFAYPLTLKADVSSSREEFVEYLEERGVRTRLFFAGNITRHPPYAALKTALPVADYLMCRSLLCGCWHGLCDQQIDYSAKVIREFFHR